MTAPVHLFGGVRIELHWYMNLRTGLVVELKFKGPGVK